MKILKLLISILLFVNAAYAAPSTDLSTLLNSLHSMRSDFTQTVYDNHGKAIQKSYGQMALQRPGKFRWEIKKPIPQVIVANDTRLWVYDPDLEQVTIRALHQAAGD
jgi:outer membrane lipoprotein carrier protein